MRRLSQERRQVVALAGSLAAISGTGGTLSRWHPALHWAWLCLYLVLLSVVIVKALRLRRSGCE
jgi:hypothetical protein